MPVSRRSFLRRGGAAIVAAPAAVSAMGKGVGDGTAATKKLETVRIDGGDYAGASVHVLQPSSVNLFRPIVAGSITLYDSWSASFPMSMWGSGVPVRRFSTILGPDGQPMTHTY